MGRGVVCSQSSGMLQSGNHSCLAPERSRLQVYSFGELGAHTTMQISANPDLYCPAQPDGGKVGEV